MGDGYSGYNARPKNRRTILHTSPIFSVIICSLAALSPCLHRWGMGIADIMAAMEPMYTTRPDMERSGMGFAFMEAFMDELEVPSSRKKRLISPVIIGTA